MPVEGETHQQLSLRMQQAIGELFDEDRTTWWEAMHRAEVGETPKLAGPTGAKWFRSWEGSRPIQRRGNPPVWK